MPAPWMKWAVAEGTVKALQRIIYKTVGATGRTLEGAITVTFITGVVQLVGGFVGARYRQKSLIPTKRQLLGSALFGLVASVMTSLAVLTFAYEGADAGVTTFIVTLSIVPGALIDWAFFAHPLRWRQWLAILLFLLSGYAVLDFPGLQALTTLPPWVGLSLIITLLLATNEGITQALARNKVTPLDPFVNNFWIGLTTIVACGLTLVVLRPWMQLATLGPAFWLGAVAIGLAVLITISFKLLSYQGGGSIAVKKLIMHGTFMVLAMILGHLIYGEALSWGKAVGVLGYFIAFTFMDDSTWHAVTRRWQHFSQ